MKELDPVIIHAFAKSTSTYLFDHVGEEGPGDEYSLRRPIDPCIAYAMVRFWTGHTLEIEEKENRTLWRFTLNSKRDSTMPSIELYSRSKAEIKNAIPSINKFFVENKALFIGQDKKSLGSVDLVMAVVAAMKIDDQERAVENTRLRHLSEKGIPPKPGSDYDRFWVTASESKGKIEANYWAPGNSNNFRTSYVDRQALLDKLKDPTWLLREYKERPCDKSEGTKEDVMVTADFNKFKGGGSFQYWYVAPPSLVLIQQRELDKVAKKPKAARKSIKTRTDTL